MAVLKAKWQTAKKEFETNTGKKKPSAEFGSFFNKASGIEPVLEKIDKETDKVKLKALVNELDQKKVVYVASLKKHQVDSNKQNYKVEIDKLLIKLEDLTAEAFDKFQMG